MLVASELQQRSSFEVRRQMGPVDVGDAEDEHSAGADAKFWSASESGPLHVKGIPRNRPFPGMRGPQSRRSPWVLVTQVGTGRCEGSAYANGPLVDLKLIGHPCPEHSGFRRMEVNVVDRGGFVPHLAGVKILDVPVFAVEDIETLQDTLPAGGPVTHIGV